MINLFKKKKIVLNYPVDFAFVEFTRQAIRLGVEDDSNKIIKRFFINRFGNYEVKIYKYTEERAYNLKEIFGIPIYDKTKKTKFPVLFEVLPGEVQFEQER